MTQIGIPPYSTQLQAVFAICYFGLYLGYLCLYPEGEALHWLTLVVAPLGGLALIGRYPSPWALLRSIGLDRANLTRGFSWVVGFGIGFQALQALNTRQRDEFLGLLSQPFGFLLPLAALALLLGTAATTEEVFFRGILQSRLADQVRSEPVALVLATFAFVLFHVPYAYLRPSWPSVGNLPWAMQLALANALPTGLALGLVYWRSRHNLFAVILLHALINLVPATLLVHRLLMGLP